MIRMLFVSWLRDNGLGVAFQLELIFGFPKFEQHHERDDGRERTQDVHELRAEKIGNQKLHAYERNAADQHGRQNAFQRRASTLVRGVAPLFSAKIKR
jgi:hypothetical protein